MKNYQNKITKEIISAAQFKGDWQFIIHRLPMNISNKIFPVESRYFYKNIKNCKLKDSYVKFYWLKDGIQQQDILKLNYQDYLIYDQNNNLLKMDNATFKKLYVGVNNKMHNNLNKKEIELANESINFFMDDTDNCQKIADNNYDLLSSHCEYQIWLKHDIKHFKQAIIEYRDLKCHDLFEMAQCQNISKKDVRHINSFKFKLNKSLNGIKQFLNLRYIKKNSKFNKDYLFPIQENFEDMLYLIQDLETFESISQKLNLNIKWHNDTELIFPI